MAPVGLVLLVLSLVPMLSTFRIEVGWPDTVLKVSAWAQPFRTVNSYGLFRVMTTERPEIIVEGSRDGVKWKTYEFKYKPGNVGRRPEYGCAPPTEARLADVVSPLWVPTRKVLGSFPSRNDCSKGQLQC